MTQESINLEAKTRSKEIKPKIIRSRGYIPAILYGQGIEPVILEVDKNKFSKVYAEAGKNTIVDLQVNEKKYKTIIHDIQFHPASDEILHADFYQISMKEKIKTEIPIIIIGESKAVKELDGSLITNKTMIEVEALPQDLIHEIEVDISNLNTFEDVIHVKDLKVPQAIEILDDSDEVVISIQPPRSEEELAELEEKVEENVENVEVEKKGKEESTEESATAEEAPSQEPER